MLRYKTLSQLSITPCLIFEMRQPTVIFFDMYCEHETVDCLDIKISTSRNLCHHTTWWNTTHHSPAFPTGHRAEMRGQVSVDRYFADTYNSNGYRYNTDDNFLVWTDMGTDTDTFSRIFYGHALPLYFISCFIFIFLFYSLLSTLHNCLLNMKQELS